MINWIFNRDWKKIKDQAVNVILCLVVIGGLVGIGYGISEAHTNAALTARSITVSSQHHAQTSTQNDTIIRLTKENTKLLKEHTSDIANESQLLVSIKTADGELAQFASWLIQSEEATCASTHAVCPPVPTLAGVTP